MVFGRRKPNPDTIPPSDELKRDEDVDESQDDLEQAPAPINRSSFRSSISSTQPSSLRSTEYKFGIADRLNETVLATNSVNAPNRSPDLIPLTKKFDAMRKRLRQLIATAKKYHKSLNTLDIDRLEV
jgi:protein required for attachment to host cells